MEERRARKLLEQVAEGRLSPDEALVSFKTAPFEDLGYAKVDLQRGLRQGVAEVVYGEGKTAQHIAGIVESLHAAGQDCILITRLDEQKAKEAQELLHLPADSFTYFEIPRIALVGSMPAPDGNGTIVVAAAGTSDLAVAEEAALVAEALGNEVLRLFDVGVAGLHRLFAHVEDLASAQVIIAVAGMEGALASVVGGMTACPVIAVPTSVGYGASFGGVAALLAMLNSCASGVSVVNIDNGFGAGYQAHLINHLKVQKKGSHSMRTLHLDLSENATRHFILQELKKQLSADEQANLQEAIDRAKVPEHHHHNLAEVNATIDTLAVSDTVKQDMLAIYDILAHAEAKVHGCSLEETHFHEVGKGEAIACVCEICLAIEMLAPEHISATAVQTGSGTVVCAHGELPIPAPATAAILEKGIPLCEKREDGELCTPTSAAIIKHFVQEFI